MTWPKSNSPYPRQLQEGERAFGLGRAEDEMSGPAAKGGGRSAEKPVETGCAPGCLGPAGWARKSKLLPLPISYQLTEAENQFFLTRVASKSVGCRKANFLSLLKFLMFLFAAQIAVIAQSQKGSDYTPIENSKIAVILIDFPDTTPAIRALYPSQDQIRNEIFNPTNLTQRWFTSMSYGKFHLTGDVFGPFTHQEGITPENNYQVSPELTIRTISIPGFNIAQYSNVVFIAYNDYNGGGGCSFGSKSATVKVNDVEWTLPSYVRMGIGIGSWHRTPDELAAPWNTYTNKVMSQIFVPLSEDIHGEHFLENYTGLTVFQRVILHELTHVLGVWCHSNSKTNGKRYAFDPQIPNNQDFIDLHYGNPFCTMGNQMVWGTSLSAGARDLLGWTDETNRIKLGAYGKKQITLFPINKNAGYKICEVRIPYKYYSRELDDVLDYPQLGRKNQGYFLEVREVDEWDATLSHPSMMGNTNGVIITQTDGWRSWLLDASPSSNLDYDWGSYPDLRDVVLKPGMLYRDNNVCFSHIVHNGDGSFSIDVEIIDPSTVPAGPPNLSFTRDGNLVCFSWPTSGTYILKQSANIFPAQWESSNFDIAGANGLNTAVVSNSSPIFFFRLFAP